MKKEAQKKGFFALRNNYLPAIITALFLFISVFANAQVYQADAAYGRQYKRVKADTTLLIPTVCGAPTLRSTTDTQAAIAFDSCNAKFYVFDPSDSTWSEVTGGGTSGITSLGDSPFGLNKVNDSTYVVDSSEVVTQYDLEGYIPLIGTSAGKPVTGNLRFQGERFLQVIDDNGLYGALVLNEDNTTVALQKGYQALGNDYTQGIYLNGRQGNDTTSILINDTNPLSTGLRGSSIFLNKQPQDFTQKHDIDLYADSLRNEIADTAAAIRADFPTGGDSKWTGTTTISPLDAHRVGIGTTTPDARLNIVDNSLTTATNDTSGITITNNTAATSAAALKFPGSFSLKFGGWNTTTGLASPQGVRFTGRPASGATGTYGSIYFEGLTTGSTWVEYARIVNNTSGIKLFVNNIESGAITGLSTVSGASINATSNGSSLTRSRTISSGTQTENFFSFLPGLTVNGASTNTIRSISNMGSLNLTAGTTRYTGIYHNPTLTSTTGLTHVAYENVSGDNLLNTTSGSTVVGGGTPASTAKLEVQSTTHGFLPPRMTGTQAEAISSPAEGLLIYSTDGSGATITSKGWWGYDGSAWVKLN